MCRALDSQARGSGAGFERAPGPSGEGAAGAGVAPPRALQSQGLGLGPRRTAGGAEAWPCAARGSSPCASLRGLGTAWPPPLPQAPGQAGPSASNLQDPPPLGGSRFLDSEAGRGRSPRTEPGRAATKGLNYSWGARACSQDLLCPQRLRRSGGEDRGKVPRAKLATFLSFSQVSIEHLLDAWHLDWGCCQGLGRNVRSSWALRVSAGNNA